MSRIQPSHASLMGVMCLNLPQSFAIQPKNSLSEGGAPDPNAIFEEHADQIQPPFRRFGLSLAQLFTNRCSDLRSRSQTT